MGTALSLALSLYFLPTIIAVVGHRRSAVLVAIVNTLLGWSVVGWVVALVMALTKDPQPQVVVLNRATPYTPVTYVDASYRAVPGSRITPS